jgi:hypothetical protein
MGQAMRMIKYDRAGNLANAVPALEFQGTPLEWHRLDDGVMGGRSETVHQAAGHGLHFCGTLNTEGGGFVSIRSPLQSESMPKEMEAIRLKFRGDGKTYKFIMSNGSPSGGPFAKNPSWQADIPTEARSETDAMQETTIPLRSLKPSFGGSVSSHSNVHFDQTEMRQIGFMLSLNLSDGTPNPKETFGDGIFSFSLLIESIDPVLSSIAPGENKEL